MKTKLFVSFVLLFIIADNHLTNSQWQQTSMTTGNISSIKANSSYIFALKNGLYRSSNAGLVWEPLNNPYIMDFCITGQYIFAGLQGEPKVLRSSDNGTNWVQVGLSNADGWMSVVASGNNIFASRYIVQRSTDGGDTWAIIPNFGSSWAYSFAASGNYIFVSLSMTSLYRSTNNGDNWAVTTLPNLHINAVVINGSKVYAAMGGSGIYISTDNGATWSQSSLNNQTVNSIAVLGNNIFAGTLTSGVYISSNGGTSWIQKNEGLTTLRVDALGISGNYIYAGVYGNGVWKRNLNELVAIHNISSEIPKEYHLFQNYPNPFNPNTKIKLSLPKEGHVSLNIYSANGQAVQNIISGNLTAGTYEADFDGSYLSSGIYFYILKANDFVQTRKMILVK